MTTLDELERSVERLKEDAKRLGKNSASSVVIKADLQLLLSERAELLATVERMRGALETKMLEAKINCDGSEVSVAYADGVIDTYNAARAALTTGEATNMIAPVAWRWEQWSGPTSAWIVRFAHERPLGGPHVRNVQPLYTHPAPIKPSGDTGELRDRVARLVDPLAFDHPTVHPQHLVRRRVEAKDKADAILSLLQSERGGG